MIGQQDVFSTRFMPWILSPKAEGNHYTNIKGDRGGPTCAGITQTVYSEYLIRNRRPVAPVQYISKGDKYAIYRDLYWLKGACQFMPDALAIVHGDACVNHGVREATKLLQRALGVPDDGRIGPATLRAVQHCDEPDAIDQYLTERDDFYRDIVDRDPIEAKFLAGWENRLKNLKEYVCPSSHK